MVLKLFFTAIAYFIGYHIGQTNKLQSPCMPDKFWETIALQKTKQPSNTVISSSNIPIIPNTANRFDSVDTHTDPTTNTFVHMVTGNIAFNYVFSMIHHPSSPVETELILTQQSSWKDDFSLCREVFAVRSPVRTDHPNRCVAVARVTAYTNSNNSVRYASATNVNHRLGVMEWPQKLSSQYQVRFFNIDHSLTMNICHLLFFNQFQIICILRKSI